MMILRKILLVSLGIFLLAGCDYTSKKVAGSELKNMPSKSFLGGSIKFVYAENAGGMLSTGSGFSEKTRLVIYQYFVSIILTALFVYTIAKKRTGKLMITALILILGGGIGNLLDRFINNGKVIDFIVVDIFNFHTGIFNLADLYVTIGVMLIIISATIHGYNKTAETT